MTKELLARSLDRPKVWFLPTKNLGEKHWLPEVAVLRRRHAIEFAVEPNKLDRNVLVPIVSKADQLAQARDHCPLIMQHLLENRPDAIASQGARMVLLEQSGAAVASCCSFSSLVIRGDQIEMRTVTDLILQSLIGTYPGLEGPRTDLAGTELQEVSSSRLSQHGCAQTSNDLAFSGERPPERSEERRSSAATPCYPALRLVSTS